MHELTERQRQIIDLIAEGMTRWRIAEELDLSESTVRDQIRNLCEMYSCPMRDLPQAVAEKWERY